MGSAFLGAAGLQTGQSCVSSNPAARSSAQHLIILLPGTRVCDRQWKGKGHGDISDNPIQLETEPGCSPPAWGIPSRLPPRSPTPGGGWDCTFPVSFLKSRALSSKVHLYTQRQRPVYWLSQAGRCREKEVTLCPSGMETE